jgi:hypothetical protein
MNSTVKTLIIAFSISLLLPAAAVAQQVKKHSSEDNGYSIAYPAEWYFRDGSDELEIATSKSAFSDDAPGAGLSVMVKETVAADQARPEKALQRILEETDSDFTLGRAGTRRIGGREWYMVNFTSKENGIDGEIFVLLRGVRVFVIGLYYKAPGARDRYQAQVERMVESFRFAERKLKTYSDQARGVSFRYPDIARIVEDTESITIVIEGENPNSDKAGAAMTVGLIDASTAEMKDLDEKAFIEMLKKMAGENDVLAVVSESQPVQVMKTTWYKSVLDVEGKRIVFVLRRYGDHFFAVVSMVNPASAAGEYEKAFEVLLGSLTLDQKKWAASLNSKE